MRDDPNCVNVCEGSVILGNAKEQILKRLPANETLRISLSNYLNYFAVMCHMSIDQSIQPQRVEHTGAAEGGQDWSDHLKRTSI